jgi:hypothetical protein
MSYFTTHCPSGTCRRQVPNSRYPWEVTTVQTRAVAVKRPIPGIVHNVTLRVRVGKNAQLPLERRDARLNRAHLVMHGLEDLAPMPRQRQRCLVQDPRNGLHGAPPAGKRRPCSRRMPAGRLMRAVRLVIHYSRTWCTATIACCSTRFTGTLGIPPQRTVSRIASTQNYMPTISYVDLEPRLPFTVEVMAPLPPQAPSATGNR